MDERRKEAFWVGSIPSVKVGDRGALSPAMPVCWFSGNWMSYRSYPGRRPGSQQAPARDVTQHGLIVYFRQSPYSRLAG